MYIYSLHQSLEYAGNGLQAPIYWGGHTVYHLLDPLSGCPVVEVARRAAKLAVLILCSLPILGAALLGELLKSAAERLPPPPPPPLPLLPEVKQLPQPSPQPHLVAQIQQEVNDLIHEVTQERIEAVRERIRRFCDEYPQDIKKSRPWIQLIDAIERSQKTWELEENYRRQYARPEFRMDDGGIVHVPDDGNCAYHAASVLLRSIGHEIDHAALRKKVYDYIVANKEEPLLQGYIADACSAYNEDLQEAYQNCMATFEALKNEIGEAEFARLTQKEQQELDSRKLHSPDDYIAKIGEERFWANLPEIYAIGMIYQIQFEVVNTPHGTLTIPDIPAQNQRLRLVYNWSPGASGTHYNCQIPK